jgi:hypothetical protein
MSKSLVNRMTANKHVPVLLHVIWLPGSEKNRGLEGTNNWYVRNECAGKEPHIAEMTGGIYGGAAWRHTIFRLRQGSMNYQNSPLDKFSFFKATIAFRP